MNMKNIVGKEEKGIVDLNGLTFVTFDGLSIGGNWRRSCERPREKWSLCKFIQARADKLNELSIWKLE